MTREEEILMEADYRYNVQHPFIDIAKASFIVGAEWADEHPEDGLVKIDDCP